MFYLYIIFSLTLLDFCHLSVLPGLRPVGIFQDTINNRTIPQQVHIALGDDNSKMVVTWNTVDPTDISIVRFGIGKFTYTRPGNITKFECGPGNIQYIHSAIMDQLIPSTIYQYQVGNGNPLEMSSVFTFKSLPSGLNWSPRFCVYGDMGLENAKILPRIKADVAKGMYDVILHVGDFAYDMDSNNGSIGDQFMRMIEPVAAQIPYMVTPGNHEYANNFSNYKNRFRMPNNVYSNMFYSYNVGPVHIISISTEFYFYVQYGVLQILNQYEWLIKDLKTANSKTNRANQPWIIFLGHRPIYCTNNDGNDCTVGADWLRYGIPFFHTFGLEDLLYKYGVDLAIWAHEHTYERMWPVYAEKVVNSSTSGQPYKNPKATVHIVSGSAGCVEDHDTFPRIEKEYSAFHSVDYGYSRITVQNKTHLYLEQISEDKNGKMIDSIVIIRDSHHSFIPR